MTSGHSNSVSWGNRGVWALIAFSAFLMLVSALVTGRAAGKWGYSVSKNSEVGLFGLYVAGWAVLFVAALIVAFRPTPKAKKEPIHQSETTHGK